MGKTTEKTKAVIGKNGKIWERPIGRKYLFSWGIEIELGELLYGLIRILKPLIVVETGTFEGFSSVIMAQALKDNERGILHTIDYKDYGAGEMFKDCGVDEWINQIIGVSPRALEEITSKVNVDFVFLDDGHRYVDVLSELVVLDKYLQAGSYITGHDYCSHGEVKQAVDDFIKSREHIYEKVIIAGPDGLYILRRIAK